jgi:hypothetical protein
MRFKYQLIPSPPVSPQQESRGQKTRWISSPTFWAGLRPLYRHDSPTPHAAASTPHAILEVEHLALRPEAEPRQEYWREQRCLRARGAIDFDEIARHEILDPSRIKISEIRMNLVSR